MSVISASKVLQLAAATTLLASGLAVASPAEAATATATARNGICEVGEFCLFRLPVDDDGGSLSDFNTSIPDYGASQPTCYEFKGKGYGQYQCVKNNAYTAWNRTGRSVRVYFHSNYGGVSDMIANGEARDLTPALKGENASHKFL